PAVSSGAGEAGAVSGVRVIWPLVSRTPPNERGRTGIRRVPRGPQRARGPAPEARTDHGPVVISLFLGGFASARRTAHGSVVSSPPSAPTVPRVVIVARAPAAPGHGEGATQGGVTVMGQTARAHPRSARRFDRAGLVRDLRAATLDASAALVLTLGVFAWLYARIASGVSPTLEVMPFLADAGRYWLYWMCQAFGWTAVLWAWITVMLGLIRSTRRPRWLPISTA